MKKFFLFMVAFATVTLNASAYDGDDEDEGKIVYVNPHLQIGYGCLSNNDDWKNLTFGGLGCDVEFKTCPLLGISAGVDFNKSMSGYKIVSQKYGNYGEGFRIRENFSFFNFPVLAQFHIYGLAIKAGVQPQWLISAKVSYQGGVYTRRAGQVYSLPLLDEDNFKDYYNKFSLSVPVGLSYTFSVPVTVDLRCNIPVTKLSKSTVEKSQRYLTVVLSLGYRF